MHSYCLKSLALNAKGSASWESWEMLRIHLAELQPEALKSGQRQPSANWFYLLTELVLPSVQHYTASKFTDWLNWQTEDSGRFLLFLQSPFRNSGSSSFKLFPMGSFPDGFTKQIQETRHTFHPPNSNFRV